MGVLIFDGCAEKKGCSHRLEDGIKHLQFCHTTIARTHLTNPFAQSILNILTYVVYLDLAASCSLD